MYIIRKEFAFSASHQLMGLPETHPCSNLHGHNYVVTVELRSSKINPVGFVKDYRELDSIKKWIDTNLDHRHLNDVAMTFDSTTKSKLYINPTAEIMAELFFEIFSSQIPELYAVEISETPKTSARYEKS